MFKPGDIAKFKTSGQSVTVTATDETTKIQTTGGIFDEADLAQAKGAYEEAPEKPSIREMMDKVLSGKEKKGPQTEDQKKAHEAYLAMTKRRDAIEAKIHAATLDYNGHWRNGEALWGDINPLKDTFVHVSTMSDQDAQRLIDDKKPLKEWVPIKLHLSGMRTCPYCGEEDFEFETNGNVVRFAGEPCRFPKGLPPTEFELNVPSGTIVVANDLRALFPVIEDDFNVNLATGKRDTTLAYAAVGLAHAFVGNTCPGVYGCEDGSFKIANEPWEDATDSEPFEGESLASICTDLWWYSLGDNDEFKRRLKHFGRKAQEFNVQKIKVRPGVYRFRHNEDVSDSGPQEKVYSRFEWVREPDPVRDYLGEHTNTDVNAHAYVQAQVARWPTLYGKARKAVPWETYTEEERHNAWRAVADHVFLTIGGGIKWHQKGFPLAKVDPNVPDQDPPEFRAQYHWYPFSRPYGGLFEPAKLAPSFAKLAFRVLESVISFGMVVRDGPRGREVQYTRDRMQVAVERYRELAKQYPAEADPTYVTWLSQPGRAETWVRNFDLGPTTTKKHLDHVKAQRWIPEDAYAIEFDAKKLGSGYFTTKGMWANKNDATGYALTAWEDNGQEGDDNCFWSVNARDTTAPLNFVARIVKVGHVSHMGETLVELGFDYGTPWMKDPGKRKALREVAEKAGIRVLTRKEYDLRLKKILSSDLIRSP